MLSLYTLTPGVTSTFRDIRVCSKLCPDNETSTIKLYNGKDSSKLLPDPFMVFEVDFNTSMASMFGHFCFVNLVLLACLAI